MSEIKYGWPGDGAIEYAREYVNGITREQAATIIRKLLTEPPEDKRIKRCDYCGYPWRDDSLRNTKRTCSDECKTAAKTLQKRQQRADKTLLEGEDTRKKRKKSDVLYTWWLEYPFWANEYEMLKYSWKYEVPHTAELMDFVTSQRNIYGSEGNRKKKAQKPGYEDERMGRKFNEATRVKLRG